MVEGIRRNLYLEKSTGFLSRLERLGDRYNGLAREARSPGYQSVLFTDSNFLFAFLPALLVLYFLSGPARGKFTVANGVIGLSSVVFLWQTDWIFAAILLAFALFLHVVGRTITTAHDTTQENSTRPISALPELSLALGLTGLIMFYLAYALPNPIGPLVAHNASQFDGHRFSAMGLLAPLGLTVFICHAVSYVVDTYRQQAVAYKNPVHVLAYLLGFPFIVAGPIIQYRDISKHLITRQIGMASFSYGVRRFTIGLCKVVLIAQTLALPTNGAFSTITQVGFGDAWLVLVCLSLQVYFDFSGYSDMAIGLGRMFGFRVPENFNMPYSAGSLTEFWQRWNISLTNWCRNYFHATGGQHVGQPLPRTSSLIVLFLGITLWHGPRIGILIWGGLHASFVLLEHTRVGNSLRSAPMLLRRLYLFLVVAAGWVFFYADSVSDALSFFRVLGGVAGSQAGVTSIPMSLGTWGALAVGLLTAAPVIPTIGRWSVTVDALATALQMIVTTAAMFVWVRIFRQQGPKNVQNDDGEPKSSNEMGD